MDDKIRDEITKSINDAVSNAIVTQILNHNSKFDDKIRFARYDVVVNDDDDSMVEFNFVLKLKR